MKIVINCCYGGFSVSRTAFLWLQEQGCKEALKESDIGEKRDADFYFSNITRNDPLLIKAVEHLGETANGRSASLKVIEIPDGTEWQIEEYDGQEWISEKHRTWG